MLADGARDRRRGVLVTITGLTGTGARAIGTHMAVLDNGDSAGSFSSGCVERAIAAEALDVLEGGASRTVRFGQGSPYIDIKLPCGGGMDVLFQPNPRADVIEQALDQLEARRPIVLELDPAGPLRIASEARQEGAGWQDDIFSVSHAPPLRLLLLGHGAEMLTSLKLAHGLGIMVELYSPEHEVVDAGLAAGAPSVLLKSVSSPVDLQGDPWTAFLFLFHDHDWEPPLIAKALETSSFWVGAMGSSRTHEARRAALAAYGVPDNGIARVKGPVGLIPSSRDPATLALSALAEIVGAYRTVRP